MDKAKGTILPAMMGPKKSLLTMSSIKSYSFIWNTRSIISSLSLECCPGMEAKVSTTSDHKGFDVKVMNKSVHPYFRQRATKSR